MEILDAGLLGVVQGVTEFLPISSSGHLILTREVFGFYQADELAFDAVLHFATALAVLAYFRREIVSLCAQAFHWIAGKEVEEHSKVLIVALITATVPAVVVGVFLEEIMATLFRNALLVAGALIAGSFIMLFAEKFSARWLLAGGTSSNEDPLMLGWRRALVVGLFQSLALIPGISRSGMAISGGMLMGLSRAASARFAFLLAIPLLLGAGGKKLIDLGASGALVSDATVLIFGAVSAFIIGIVAIHYLLRFLRTHSLMVFIWYRLILAGLVLFVIFV